MAVVTRWSAVLLAGSRLRGHPKASSLLMGHKALIEVGGVPMVLRPLQSLLDSPEIDRIAVMAQDIVPLRSVIPNDRRVSLKLSMETIARTVQSLVADDSAHFPMLVTTADHALLSPAMIAQFCSAAAGADLAIGVVESAGLLARFPQAQRTWIGFKGGRYSGANLFAFGSAKVAGAVDHWSVVEQERKKGWRLLFALGPSVLLGALFKLRTIEQTAAAIGGKLGLSIRIVQLSDPLAAIDVDKPADLEMVEAILAGTA
ncbi:MAG: NTP transferase domain-containing protein [Sphingomonas sp.]|nr:NTP transferase domain-containing protein [Sphingomonas sp.]